MSAETILVVEDEPDILELVSYNLKLQAFKVVGKATGEDALLFLKETQSDLILLDLMLPGIDGLDVCRKVKDNPDTQHIPIIMVTAKGDETDIVAGLELGADDYVTKPFSPKVLLARVNAVLRRKQVSIPSENERIVIGDLSVHPDKHEVRFKDRVLKLTQTEFRILHIFALRPGWVFTRAQLVDKLHDGFVDITERSIDVQIVGLRKNLGQAGVYIKTVRGIGYRLEENVES